MNIINYFGHSLHLNCCVYTVVLALTLHVGLLKADEDQQSNKLESKEIPELNLLGTKDWHIAVSNNSTLGEIKLSSELKILENKRICINPNNAGNLFLRSHFDAIHMEVDKLIVPVERFSDAIDNLKRNVCDAAVLPGRYLSKEIRSIKILKGFYQEPPS